MQLRFVLMNAFCVYHIHKNYSSALIFAIFATYYYLLLKVANGAKTKYLEYKQPGKPKNVFTG